MNLSFKHYWDISKPKVVMLMVFTAWVGMLLAQPWPLDINAFIFGTIGISLMAASAAAVNHLVDRRIDAEMGRTHGRPLPQGNISVKECFLFAAIIGGLGLLVLLVAVNWITAILTAMSLVGYAVIYTLYLKRATPLNIVIGGLAGATPPLLGWTAVTGQIEAYPLILTLLIFAWTPPHFWALAIYKKDEYAKVDIPMLPVTHGEDFTRLQILLYTILMIALSYIPFALQRNGWSYVLGVTIINAQFFIYAFRLWKTKDVKLAIRTFVYSIIYLFALFALLLVDGYYLFLSA